MLWSESLLYIAGKLQNIKLATTQNAFRVIKRRFIRKKNVTPVRIKTGVDMICNKCQIHNVLSGGSSTITIDNSDANKIFENFEKKNPNSTKKESL